MLTEKKKCQTAIELVIIVSFSLLFFIVFIFVVADNLAVKRSEINYQKVKDVGAAIQQEIVLASEASDGYKRKFTLPLKVAGQDYDIIVENNDLIIKVKKYSIGFTVPSFSGTLVEGQNSIRKDSGIIYIN